MLNSLGDFWQTPLRTRRNNENLKEDTYPPGLPDFQRRKNIFDSILQHLLLISHQFCWGNWSDLHPGPEPPRPWRATQMRNFILFPLLALGLVQGQEDRTGEKFFRSVTCFTLDFFWFSGASLHVFGGEV